MNINEIKDLLNQFDQSSLTEFDLKDSNFELYFNKNKNSRGTSEVTAAATAPQGTAAPISGPTHLSGESNTDLPSAESKPQPVVVEGTEVVSPLVGVVYLQPSPDKPAFKSIGDKVKKGDVLCIVEAMKVMNEINSELTGEIVDILVENEQTVEFNQPLFIVKEG